MTRLFSAMHVEAALREVLLDHELLDVDERADRESLVAEVLDALDPDGRRVAITRAGRRAASELAPCTACPTPGPCELVGQCAREGVADG